MLQQYMMPGVQIVFAVGLGLALLGLIIALVGYRATREQWTDASRIWLLFALSIDFPAATIVLLTGASLGGSSDDVVLWGGIVCAFAGIVAGACCYILISHHLGDRSR